MSQIYNFPATSTPVGGATAANQVLEIAALDAINGKTVVINTGAVVVASSALPTGASTSASQTTGNNSLASIDGKIVAVNTGAVVVASSALPTGAATAANQTTMLTRLSGALVPTAYDEVDLTYVVAGNGIGQIATAVYKLATVTVKTLTLTYDASDRLSTTVAS